MTLCTEAKRCVLEQKLEPIGSRINEKLIGTKMNDLDLCLEVVSRSRQPLTLNISDTVRDRGLVPKDHQ